MRTKVDVDSLAHEISEARNAVVLGGGFIGLEADAVLRKLGLGVTVVESLDRVLARVAAEPLSKFFEAEHAAHGVKIALSATVTALIGESGRVRAVELADGFKIDADLVIVGIGIVPTVDAVEQAGGAVDNGVVVDMHARTSLEGIYAIGDCARRPSRFSGGSDVRLESVPNATDQAMVAARSICGLEQNVETAPWFWSHQYDLKLQTVGLTAGYDDAVVRGDPETRCFSVVYLRDNAVIAIDAVNRTQDFVQGRKLVEARATPARGNLEDIAIPLKNLL